MPTAAATCRTLPILKQAKPGVQVDLSDPSSYRPITVGNVLPKVLGLVINKRLQHWAVTHGIISEEQVGFMPGKGCEDHVYSLLETVRARWRMGPGRDTYALFIDISKAYDAVHPAALWAVLRRAGVPEDLVELLANWSASRTTCIQVNGQYSQPIAMALGLGQGDVLSPLLYNIFSDSMTCFVNAAVRMDPANGEAYYRGVRVEVPGQQDTQATRITELKYADDSVFLASGVNQLQKLLDRLHAWCQAWGVTIGIGQGKTEAMFFRHPGDPAGTTAATHQHALTLGDKQVPWTQEYRYLGLHLRSDLTMKGMTEALKRRVVGSWCRYFAGSSLITSCSPALALQMLNTLVCSVSSYLLGFLQPTEALCKKIDRFMLSTARQILHLPSYTPVAVIWAESRLLPLAAVAARDQTRLHMKLQFSPLASPIAKRLHELMRGAHADDTLAAPAHMTSLYRLYKQQQQAWADSYGMSVPDPDLQNHRLLATYVGRQLALYLTGAHLMLGPPKTSKLPDAESSSESSQPSGGPDTGRATAQHVTAQKLRGAIARTVKAHKEAGRPHGPGSSPMAMYVCGYFRAPGVLQYMPHWLLPRTPISMHAPGCNGNLVALFDGQLPAQQMRAIMRARLGRPGLWLSPYAPASRRGDPAAPTEGGQQPAVPYAHRHGWARCLRCRAQPEDTFHVLTECTYAPVLAARQLAITSLPAMLKEVLATCTKVGATKAPATLDGSACLMEVTLPAAQSGARRATAALPTLATMDWASAEARFLLFQLLAALPWTATAARAAAPQAEADGAQPAMQGQHHISILLGVTLDQTVPRPGQFHAAVRAWVPWAGKHALAIAEAWATDPPTAAPARGATPGAPSRRRARTQRARQGADHANRHDSDSDSDTGTLSAAAATRPLRRSARLAATRANALQRQQQQRQSTSSGSASDSSASGSTD